MNDFTAQNILEVTETTVPEGMVVKYEIGNTDSDVGMVEILLTYATDDGNGVPLYDADIATDCMQNWGLWAAVSAIRVAVEDIYKRAEGRFVILDNTRIEG